MFPLIWMNIPTASVPSLPNQEGLFKSSSQFALLMFFWNLRAKLILRPPCTLQKWTSLWKCFPLKSSCEDKAVISHKEMQVCKWKAAHSRTVINLPWLTSREMETWKGKVRLVEWNPHIFIWKEKTQQHLVAMQHNHVILFPFPHHPVQPCPYTTAILQPVQDKFVTFGHKKPAKPCNYRYVLAIKLNGNG